MMEPWRAFLLDKHNERGRTTPESPEQHGLTVGLPVEELLGGFIFIDDPEIIDGETDR